MTVFFGCFAFLFGLVFGSFYNCMAMRLSRREDFVRTRSHCMDCGHELSGRDLVPVFSFLFSGGRCRYCGKKMSPRYPLTEILFGVLTLVLYLVEIGDPSTAELTAVIRFFRDFFLTGMLFSLSIVDLEIYEIPNGILVAGLLAWVLTAPFLFTPFFLGTGGEEAGLRGVTAGGVFSMRPGWQEAGLHVLSALMIGALMLGLSAVMNRILKKDSLGGGDIKLFALLGLYLGFFGTYALLLFSSLFGLLMAALMRSRKIPFGPAIAAAGYLVLLFGGQIEAWYLSLLGI